MTLASDLEHRQETQSEYLLFKEVATREELIQHFALRYKVYTYHGYMEHNLDELDIDPYDFWSRFLVCYANNSSGKTLVGGIRMVMREISSPFFQEIQELVESARDPRLRFAGERSTVFPSEQAFRELTTVVEEFESRGKKVVEFSRTVRLPDWNDPLIQHGLMVGAFGLGLLHRAGGTVGSSSERVGKLYRRHGGNVVKGVPLRAYPGINVTSVALKMDFSEMPEHSRQPAQLFAEKLSRDGYFCLCKNKQCLKSEYMSQPVRYPCPQAAFKVSQN